VAPCLILHLALGQTASRIRAIGGMLARQRPKRLIDLTDQLIGKR
jgi:hypothetical protein